MAYTSPAFLGSWYVQTDNHIHFLQLNRDFSFVRFTLDLYQTELSHHGWGRFEISPSDKPNQIDVLLSFSVATQHPHRAKIRYQLNLENNQLTLKSGNDNPLLLHSLEPHHTIGFWPNPNTANFSYLAVLPSGHYVEVTPSDNQAQFSTWQWGELINADVLRSERLSVQ